MDTKIFTDKSGNEYTIAPLSPERVTAAVRYLRKEKGIVVSSDDTKFENGLEFNLALATFALTKLVLAGIDGAPGRELNSKERAEFVASHTGATAWITSKANSLAVEDGKLYEDERGN